MATTTSRASSKLSELISINAAWLLCASTLLLAGCRSETPEAESQAIVAEDNSPLGHTRAILSYGPRTPGSAGALKVRGYVTEVLTEAGWVVGTQSFQARTPLGERSFTNLIARFPSGKKEAVWKQPVKGLFCAHLDSKLMPGERFLGADDAASACGLILTMAQELASEPEKAAQLELIFFDGEEAFTRDMGPKPGGIFDGLYGSRKYAERWRSVKKKPEFGILLDMVGHRDLQIAIPTDSPPELAALLFKKAKKVGESERFGWANGEIFDDHVPLNAVGIPTLDIIGDFQRSDWWHTPKDNLSLVSAESLAITHRITKAMLAELLAE